MSTPTNDGGQAFPGFDWIDQAGRKNPAGMTIRDYFAGQALAGMPWSPSISVQDQSTECYQIADAMLAARERKEGTT